MHPIPRRRGGWTLRRAMPALAVAVSFSAAAKDLSFDTVFRTQGEPPTLHDKALVLAKGQERPLEVWRDHDRRLKRVTGDDLEIYATKTPGQTEFSLSILDKKKRIHTRIDRSKLYRIGNFADGFDLAHGLRHPAGPHRIAQSNAPKDAPQAAVPCT